MNKNSSLKPCPFCGKDDVTLEFWLRSYSLHCNNPDCNAYTDSFDLKSEARKVWNLRVKIYKNFQQEKP